MRARPANAGFGWWPHATEQRGDERRGSAEREACLPVIGGGPRLVEIRRWARRTVRRGVPSTTHFERLRASGERLTLVDIESCAMSPTSRASQGSRRTAWITHP